jgi:hypothetical protein
MKQRTELLDRLTAAVRDGASVSFVKRGDGEEFCMAGQVGENCDGHPYSGGLARVLMEAFGYFGRRPDVTVALWRDQERYQSLLHCEGMVDETRRFWMAAREAKRPKIFVGPERLAGAATMLRAEHVVVPLVNAFGWYAEVRNRLLTRLRPGMIFIFCAGMPAKGWIAEVLEACRGASCIDAGSAFDPLFVGNTRTGQLSREAAWDLYRGILPPLVHAVIFSKNRAMQLDALLRSMRRFGANFWPPTILWKATDARFEAAYEQLTDEFPDCWWTQETRFPSFAYELLACLSRGQALGALFSDDDVFFREVPAFEVGAGQSFSLRFGGGAASVDAAVAAADGVLRTGLQPCLGWSCDGNVHPIEELRVAVKMATPLEPNLIEGAMNVPARAVREIRAEKSCLVSIPHNLVQDVYPNPNMGGSAAELNDRWLAGERIDLDAMDFSGVTDSHAFLPYAFRKAS